MTALKSCFNIEAKESNSSGVNSLRVMTKARKLLVKLSLTFMVDDSRLATSLTRFSALMIRVFLSILTS